MMEGGGLPSFFDTSSMIYADADGNPTGPGMSNGGGGGGMDIEMMTEEEERNEAREVGKVSFFFDFRSSCFRLVFSFIDFLFFSERLFWD